MSHTFLGKKKKRQTAFITVLLLYFHRSYENALMQQVNTDIARSFIMELGQVFLLAQKKCFFSLFFLNKTNNNKLYVELATKNNS